VCCSMPHRTHGTHTVLTRYSYGAVCLFQEVLALIAELNAGEPRTGAHAHTDSRNKGANNRNEGTDNRNKGTENPQ
jgi:hypothetical protein